MWAANTDIGARLADLGGIHRHDRFNRAVEMLLNPVKLLWMIHFAQGYHVQYIQVGREGSCERGRYRCSMSGFDGAIRCVKNPSNIQRSGLKNINSWADR